MTELQIRVQEYKDKDTPIYPELSEGKELYYGLATKAAVLEKATANGNTSVQIIAEKEDGKVLVIETTAKLFNGLAAVAKGNAQRWGDTEI